MKVRSNGGQSELSGGYQFEVRRADIAMFHHPLDYGLGHASLVPTPAEVLTQRHEQELLVSRLGR